MVFMGLRLDIGLKSRVDGLDGVTTQDFIRLAIEEKLERDFGGGDVSEVSAAVAPVSLEVEVVGSVSDADVLFREVEVRGGLTERDAVRVLGWMEGRVSRAARELSGSGRVWYPVPGKMEVLD